MSHRPFSNNKIKSYNDYNKQKNCNIKQLCAEKLMYSQSYSRYLSLKQNCINNCYSFYSCIKSPMNIIQGKTSYICNNNNMEKDLCKNIKNTMYPYGYYLCENNVCNVCINSAAI